MVWAVWKWTFAGEIATRLRVRASFVNIDAGGGLDALLGDQYDMILAGLSAAPDLQKRIAFSAPYFDDGPIALLRADSCPLQLNLAGVVIGTEIGSDGDQAARRLLAGRDEISLRRFDERSELLRALRSGEIGAVILDGTSARLARRDHPGLCLASEPLRNRPLAIALQRRNLDLRFAVDEVLADLATSGWLRSLEQKWTGTSETSGSALDNATWRSLPRMCRWC